MFAIRVILMKLCQVLVGMGRRQCIVSLVAGKGPTATHNTRVAFGLLFAGLLFVVVRLLFVALVVGHSLSPQVNIRRVS